MTSSHAARETSSRCSRALAPFIGAALVLVVACAGPGTKLQRLDHQLAAAPDDKDALRQRVEVLSDWRDGPDDRLILAAKDAQRLGGRLLIPEYNGTHRWFLTREARVEVLEAIGLLERALDWNPSGEHKSYTLGKLAEANTLLAEDTRNRTSPPVPNEFDRLSLNWATRLAETYPDDPYGHYGRGIAYLRFGDALQAIESFKLCDERCEQRLANAGDEDLAYERDLRFKSRLRRAEAFGRMEKTAESIVLIKETFGELAMESAFAVSAAYRTAGEYGEARVALEALLDKDAWAQDPGVALELACLAAIECRNTEAHDLLTRCLERSQFDLSSTEGANLFAYAALWRWMLASSEIARVELVEIVEQAPIGDWERVLLAFTGWNGLTANARESARQTNPDNAFEPGTEEWLLTCAKLELAQRVVLNEDPDDLRAEAWFYLGWRRRNEGRADADEAFQHCIELADPNQSKWEFDFARRYLTKGR